MASHASDLHRNAIVVVGHSDIAASDIDGRREAGEEGILARRHLPTLRKGGVTVVCDHVGGDAPYGYLPATRLSTTYHQRFMRSLDNLYAELDASEDFVLALTAQDIRDAKRNNKIAFVVCLEGASPLQGEISYLRHFHRLGLRCIGLTHDVRNEVADGIRELSGGGLTHFGTRVVDECNRLGIVIDVSHLSDKGTEDVLARSRQPITASHSNARALCGNRRNLPDHLIRGIATSGGVIGFHALHALVTDEAEVTLDHLLAHIDYLAEVGGIDCIAIGPDIMENWDPTPFVSVYASSKTVESIPTGPLRYRYPEGMASNADLPNLTEALLKRGYSDEDLIKFLGGNLMRLFDAVWTAPGRSEGLHVARGTA